MTYLAELLTRTDAPQIIAEAQKYLNNEQLLRKQFYENLTPSVKAEFIGGVVVLHSPVKKNHNTANGLLFSLLNTYVNINDLGFVGMEKILIQCSRNDYEPDICYFANAKADSFTEEQMLFPPPDFVVEIISKSTERTDRKTKFEDYALHGIAEYWIIAPKKQTVEQYQLVDKKYELVKIYQEAEMIECLVLPELKFRVNAIFDKKQHIIALKRLFL